MNEPLISIIMPAYNAEKYIKRAIESMLNQTHKNIELLIADDASQDETKKIVDSYTNIRIKTYHNNKNLGYLKTCNILFNKAKGDYIAFQDADDYSDTRRFEIQLKAFANDPELGACGTNFISLNEKGDEFLKSDFPSNHIEIRANIINGNFCIIPNAFLIKKEVLKNIGGYNEFFNRIGAEDYYWTWLIMEKYKLINIKQNLYFYQYQQNSITGNWSDNFRKFFSRDLVMFLIKQRIKFNFDGLSDSELAKEFNKFIEIKEKPFKEDKSYLYRKLSIKDFYSDRKKRAVQYAFKAFKINPFKIENLKNLIYFLRK
ncbi:MAG: glycosyltransferase family 2 protein [Bacteroidetes bacterium]|nr:glycosyltransferase family 2 protein [Bacteroidota bacterium]